MQMKALDNPLESTARKDMASKYSFLLLMTFEGAVKVQDWTSLSGIIQVTLLSPSSAPQPSHFDCAGCGDGTNIVTGF